MVRASSPRSCSTRWRSRPRRSTAASRPASASPREEGAARKGKDRRSEPARPLAAASLPAAYVIALSAAVRIRSRPNWPVSRMARDQVDLTPIETRDELVAWFAAGIKPKPQFRLGTEHEKFAFTVEAHRPVPY